MTLTIGTQSKCIHIRDREEGIIWKRGKNDDMTEDSNLTELIQFPPQERRSLHIKQWTTPFNCAKEPNGLNRD